VVVAYFAGPLFTDAERLWNTQVVQQIRERFPALTLHVPQEFGEELQKPDEKPDFALVFAACRDHLQAAEIVIAVLDGADADSGTAWELGYAVASGKTCLGLRTDWRPAEDGSANCMLNRSCQQVCRSVDELLTVLAALPQVR
jgi:nucleoside 2-deoxyribosyltransferase